jgi:hypothetical protein
VEAEMVSYGVITGGAELMRWAWPTLDQRFSVRHQRETVPAVSASDGSPKIIIGNHRYKANLLQQYPVDLVVVERGAHTKPPTQLQREPWESLVEGTSLAHRPKVILEVWVANAQLWSKGPMCGASVSRWSRIGYGSQCRLVRATAIGGSICQSRLVIARVQSARGYEWTWDSLDRDPDLIRPMSNLLTPPGLVNRRLFVPGKSPSSDIPNCQTDPMPNRVGSLIQTEHGIRRLSIDEVARGLGVPKGSESGISQLTLERTTSVFLWEYLSGSLQNLRKDPNPCPSVSATRANTLKVTEVVDTRKGADVPLFSWTPPDLRVGSDWYNKRVANLSRASAGYSTSAEIFQDGIRRLALHRANYDDEGPAPTWLQLLWWEFPPEHWDDLRLGARQNFLVPPEPQIHPNAPMDANMTQAAADFVDELLTLGVVRDIDEGQRVLTTAPLFVVPKEGQEGQWRVIADMLRGGQNECVGQDPVFLPRVSHMLDQMYTGGYSAVVDLSKFFYNFPTHPDDRPYLGLLHPITDVLYSYFGLAMGAGNSPALAGRYGLSFVRLVKERFSEFSGKGRANCYWTGLRDGSFDPKLGYGFILEDATGGSVHIWVWVDDFLIHGPTYAKTARALRFFLDTAVDCGFLFHPKKLILPAQEVKYCGFLFDTREIPCLRIPVPKRERALAICEYLLDAPLERQWSRLSLAVAAGVLESLSEATPRRLGHTYLRHFHGVVHPPGIGTGAEPYYTVTSLNADVRRELQWWAQFLLVGEGRLVRPRHAATLIPTFGDGSGTGTGGTFVLPDGPLQMWRGKWKPAVYHFPSVWKELATLKETLLRLQQTGDREAARDTTVFYFTDNSGVYWIALSGSSRSPNLQRLIEEIRLLELDLGCYLQVIHVPGLVLITQGTDGLSRGIWMSSYHSLMDEARLTQAIFDPLPFDPDLVREYLPLLSPLCPCSSWQYQVWSDPWEATRCFDNLTVWFPPPEIARQALTFTLNLWVERPHTTAALFFVPRVMEGSWRNLSRYVIEAGLVFPHLRELRFPPILPIPIVILYLPAHTCSLGDRRSVDLPPRPPGHRWHREQAAHMRGLPPRLLPPG